MTSNRFFIQKASLHKSSVLLTGEKHHHLHSVVRMKSGDQVQITLAQALIKAAKQSGNTKVPTILAPKPLSDVLKEEEVGLKIFLSERGGTYLKKILRGDNDSVKQRMDRPLSVRVLIGPEGGWTEQEEHDILGHDYKAISLGPQILRAETAAISCLVLINHFWNL